MADAAKLFDATLKEEKATDLKLTDLAENEISTALLSRSLRAPDCWSF
jgi:ferritin-like metal-binding protein YciE